MSIYLSMLFFYFYGYGRLLLLVRKPNLHVNFFGSTLLVLGATKLIQRNLIFQVKHKYAHVVIKSCMVRYSLVPIKTIHRSTMTTPIYQYLL